MSPNLKNFSRLVFLFLVFLALALPALSQNFTSNAAGVWTTGSNWVGGTAPSLTAQGYGTIQMNHDMSITGNYNLPGGSLNVNAGKKLTISGNLVVGIGGGGNTINVYGTLEIAGNVTLSSNLRVHPGGKVVVDGSVTVMNAQYLTVGTAVAPPAYADMIIKQNLVSQQSGDIIVNQNGRLGVFGNVSNNTSGGTILRVNNGGQVYVHGNINLTSGGNDIIANNTAPLGLYVNGTISNPSGNTSSNIGNQTTLANSNPVFFDWLANQSGSPLPVELLFFNALKNNGSVELTWATASQLNFDYFSVEYSTDGLVWTEIERIKGEGTTQNKDEYDLKNVKVLTGTNYYRLRMVDLDGTFEYSKVAMIIIEAPMLVSIYPNPVKQSEAISIELNFTPNDVDKVIVYNSFGVELMNFAVSSTKLSVPLSDLKAGTYIVKYVSANSSLMNRLVVQ